MSHSRAFLTLWPTGRATFNREASRVLPVGVEQVRLVPPTSVGNRWRLLTGVPGGHRVHARADRLGYLRFSAPWWAAQCFAARPPGTLSLRFEVVPCADLCADLYTLEPLAA